jgi:hypothetical protein
VSIAHFQTRRSEASSSACGFLCARYVPARSAVPSTAGRATRTRCGHSVETELVALDVLHHEARLVVAIGRQ